MSSESQGSSTECSSDKKVAHNDSDNRWWEFYGIRYAQGTVLGAILAYSLFSSNPISIKLLFLPSIFSSFSFYHLILYTAYGLTYCYISSAPILVLHACRGYILYQDHKCIFKNSTNIIASLFIAFLFTIALYSHIPGLDKETNISILISLVLFYCIVTYQLIIINNASSDNFKCVTDYYNKLINNRSNTSKDSYVESYRHLREHGNSFAIVICEILLALILYNILSHMNEENRILIFIFSTIILFIWIIPASLVYFIGTKMEQHLKEQ